MPKNPFVAGGGAHDAPPDPLVGWGGGYPVPDLSRLVTCGALTSRLRRLPLGASIFAHPCKTSWRRLCRSSTSLDIHNKWPLCVLIRDETTTLL